MLHDWEQAPQARGIAQQEVGTLVAGEAPGEAERQDVGIERALG